MQSAENLQQAPSAGKQTISVRYMIGRKKDVCAHWLYDYFLPITEPIGINTKEQTQLYKAGENCSINTILNQVTTRSVLFVNEIQLRESSLSFSSLNGEKILPGCSFLQETFKINRSYFHFKCRNYPTPRFPQGSMFTLLESCCLI